MSGKSSSGSESRSGGRAPAPATSALRPFHEVALPRTPIPEAWRFHDLISAMQRGAWADAERLRNRNRDGFAGLIATLREEVGDHDSCIRQATSADVAKVHIRERGLLQDRLTRTESLVALLDRLEPLIAARNANAAFTEIESTLLIRDPDMVAEVHRIMKGD